MTALHLPAAAARASGASLPSDRGFLAQTHPIEDCTAAGAVNTGAIYLSKIWIPSSLPTVTNVHCAVTTAIAGAPANCFAGLFTSAGVLIGTSADRSTAWASLGLDTAAIVGGPVLVTGGTGAFIWGALLVGTGTTVQFGRKTAVLTLLPNANLTAANAYASSSGGGLAGQTSLPPSFTPGSNTTTVAGAFWMALS